MRDAARTEKQNRSGSLQAGKDREKQGSVKEQGRRKAQKYRASFLSQIV
jgi:hypothetical protein